MMTFTAEQLQTLLYEAKVDAVTKYRAIEQAGKNTTWIDIAQFYKELHDEAGRVASNAQQSPIDLNRIASVL